MKSQGSLLAQSMFSILFMLSSVNGLEAQSITLTYANFPPASTFPCIQMEKWKTEVELRSAGIVTIKTFSGSTLLGAKDMMNGVINGVADIGVIAFAYQPERFPLLTGMDLPTGFSSSKVATAVLFDLYEKYRPQSLSKVKVLALFTSPPANIISKTPIKSLQDLKGYKLRCTGTGVMPLKLLGATPVPMPMSKTPEALQKGIADGIFSSLDILKDFNFAKKCEYVTICDMQTTSFAVIMNKNRWNMLPQNIKKIMNDLAREHSLWTGEYIDKHVMKSLEWATNNYNEKIIRLDDRQYKLWHEKVAPIKDEWLKRTRAMGLPARQFLNDLMTLKAKYEKHFAENGE